MANRATVVLTILLLVTAHGRASAQAGRDDALIFADIADQVNRYTQYTVFDSVSAQVNAGRVVLTGWVTQPFKRDDIERRVRRIDGLRSLENAIGVLPVSPADDELRFRIAHAIYAHSSFWHYASMVNPPIHIVVNRGRVALEGVVGSNVERMLARSLATGFGAIEVANDLRTEAELRETMETRP
jgi:hyperosmotically inducible protein